MIMYLQSDRQSHHAQAALSVLRDLQVAPGMKFIITLCNMNSPGFFYYLLARNRLCKGFRWKIVFPVIPNLLCISETQNASLEFPNTFDPPNYSSFRHCVITSHCINDFELLVYC